VVFMSAEPVAEHEDPLDPQRILAGLPEDERGFFLSQYRQAVEAARDPAGWGQLRKLLLRWGYHAQAAAEPGYRQAQEEAAAGTGPGMLLSDYVALRRAR
jgi:hypothetical protein